MVVPTLQAEEQQLSNAELQQAVLAIQKIQILDRTCLLVGMGLTKLMNDDFYIGAFYMDDLADRAAPEDLIELQVPRRMEYKFASDRRIPASSFKRELVQAIKINNDKSLIRTQRDNLYNFVRAFKGSYKKGDTITFDYHPSFGTRVSVNGKAVLEVAAGEPEFYAMLVRTWVGRRPPSSAFLNGIMGRADSNEAILLLNRYVTL